MFPFQCARSTFSKKLNKVIQNEANKEAIRERVKNNNGIYVEGSKTYYAKKDKIEIIDDSIKQKKSSFMDIYIKNDEIRNNFSILMLSLSFALIFGIIAKKSFNYKQVIEDSDYETNYQKALKDQKEWDEQQEAERLKKFRENENADMAKEMKQKDFK